MDQVDMETKVDTYLKLHDRQMAHYENTQGIEWKVSIALWTLLAAAIAWASNKDSLAGSVPAWGWSIALFLVVAAHALWLGLVHSSEEEDKKLWDRFRVAAETALGEKDVKPYKGRGKWKAMLWLVSEAGVTAGMALVLLLLVVCR